MALSNPVTVRFSAIVGGLPDTDRLDEQALGARLAECRAYFARRRDALGILVLRNEAGRTLEITDALWHLALSIGAQGSTALRAGQRHEALLYTQEGRIALVPEGERATVTLDDFDESGPKSLEFGRDALADALVDVATRIAALLRRLDGVDPWYGETADTILRAINR